jgi:hypothetical protein
MAEEALKLANETSAAAIEKAHKFRSIGVKRVNHCLKVLGLIGNLSNRSAYIYSDNDVRKLIDTLRKAVDRLEMRFTRSSDNGGFTF